MLLIGILQLAEILTQIKIIPVIGITEYTLYFFLITYIVALVKMVNICN